MRVDYHIGSRRYVTIHRYPSVLGAMFGPLEDTPCTVLDVCIRRGERHELCTDMFMDWPTPHFDLNGHVLDEGFRDIYPTLGAVQVARIEHPELADDLAVWQREIESVLHRRATQRQAATNQGDS